jgi:hypothetical protein
MSRRRRTYSCLAIARRHGSLFQKLAAAAASKGGRHES